MISINGKDLNTYTASVSYNGDSVFKIIFNTATVYDGLKHWRFQNGLYPILSVHNNPDKTMIKFMAGMFHELFYDAYCSDDSSDTGLRFGVHRITDERWSELIDKLLEAPAAGYLMFDENVIPKQGSQDWRDLYDAYSYIIMANPTPDLYEEFGDRTICFEEINQCPRNNEGTCRVFDGSSNEELVWYIIGCAVGAAAKEGMSTPKDILLVYDPNDPNPLGGALSGWMLANILTKGIYDAMDRGYAELSSRVFLVLESDLVVLLREGTFDQTNTVIVPLSQKAATTINNAALNEDYYGYAVDLFGRTSSLLNSLVTVKLSNLMYCYAKEIYDDFFYPLIFGEDLPDDWDWRHDHFGYISEDYSQYFSAQDSYVEECIGRFISEFFELCGGDYNSAFYPGMQLGDPYGGKNITWGIDDIHYGDEGTLLATWIKKEYI